jgi:hypothetical protein
LDIGQSGQILSLAGSIVNSLLSRLSPACTGVINIETDPVDIISARLNGRIKDRADYYPAPE